MTHDVAKDMKRYEKLRGTCLYIKETPIVQHVYIEFWFSVHGSRFTVKMKTDEAFEYFQNLHRTILIECKPDDICKG